MSNTQHISMDVLDFFLIFNLLLNIYVMCYTIILNSVSSSPQNVMHYLPLYLNVLFKTLSSVRHKHMHTLVRVE